MPPQKIQSLFIGLAFLAAAESAAPRRLRTHDTDGKLPSGSPARKRYRGCRLATAEAVSLLTLTIHNGHTLPRQIYRLKCDDAAV